MPKGERNPQAKLTDGDVELLRRLVEEDRKLPRHQRRWTGPALAEKFEISVRHVWHIISYTQRT